jgi:hypothetical protein
MNKKKLFYFLNLWTTPEKESETATTYHLAATLIMLPATSSGYSGY